MIVFRRSAQRLDEPGDRRVRRLYLMAGVRNKVAMQPIGPPRARNILDDDDIARAPLVRGEPRLSAPWQPMVRRNRPNKRPHMALLTAMQREGSLGGTALSMNV